MKYSNKCPFASVNVIYSQKPLLFIFVFSPSSLVSCTSKILENVCSPALLKTNSLVLSCWEYDFWLYPVFLFVLYAIIQCLPTF